MVDDMPKSVTPPPAEVPPAAEMLPATQESPAAQFTVRYAFRMAIATQSAWGYVEKTKVEAYLGL